MAFNNGFPVTYPQMQYPQYPQYPQPQVAQQAPSAPTMNSTIVWVKERKEAEDYLVAPNNSVVFMDEAMTHLYMKSADQFGRPTFSSKTLTDDNIETREEVPRSTQPIDAEKFLTKDEFAAWVDDTLEKRLSELKQRPQQRRNKGGNDNA